MISSAAFSRIPLRRGWESCPPRPRFLTHARRIGSAIIGLCRNRLHKFDLLLQERDGYPGGMQLRVCAEVAAADGTCPCPPCPQRPLLGTGISSWERRSCHRAAAAAAPPQLQVQCPFSSTRKKLALLHPKKQML